MDNQPVRERRDPVAGTLGWHIRRTLELALPIMVARAAYLTLATVDTVMTGWSGAEELAYLALGTAPLIAIMLVGVGAVQAVSVLTAQALGAGTPERVGAVLRSGLVYGCLLGLLIMGLSALTGAFFAATGQLPELIDGAVKVVWQYAWAMPGLLMFVACGHFLEATERPYVAMTIMIVINIANVPANGIFVLGWGDLVTPLGAEGAVFTSSWLRMGGLVAILIYIANSARRAGDPHKLLIPGKIITALREAVSPIGLKLCRIGIPMGLAQGVESAAFASLMLIAGRIGAAALAAHQVTQTMMSLAFMLAIGMMSATAIRVGNAVGRGDSVGVRRAGWTGIGLGGAVALIPMMFFIVFPGEIAAMITDDPQVISFAVAMLMIAALALSIDAMMGVSIGAVRGLGDVWPAFFIQIVAFWIISVPLAAYLCLSLEMGPVGLIWAILVGVMISFAALALRFWIISHRPMRAL